MSKVAIIRPSLLTGRPSCRVVHIVRDCHTYRGTEQGRPVFVQYAPGGPEFLEVLSDAEQANITN